MTHTAPTGCATNKPPLLVRAGAFLHGHGQIAAHGGDLSAEGACSSPYAHAGGQNPPSLPEPARQTTGATAARRRGRAHTARQAERARPEAGRQTAETAATAGRAPRAQPTLANGQRTREVVPLPPLKFPLGCEPQASTTRGRGERPVGAAGEGERPDAKQNAQLCPTPRQALRPSAKQAPGGKPRARRKGAKATRQPVARTHERARPAAKPTRPTTERRPAGAGATAPHHEHQRRRDHASGRRNGGEAGGDGAGRAALGRDCWPPTPCHQRRAPH